MTLPGVMMSSAAQRLIHLYAIRPGKTAVVVTGNDDGYANALDLADAGVEVAAIVDLRDKPDPALWLGPPKNAALPSRLATQFTLPKSAAIIWLGWKFAKYSVREYVTLRLRRFAVTQSVWRLATRPPISSPVRPGGSLATATNRPCLP